MTRDLTDRRRVLVAGIGNVFFGDDAFGVEVVGRIDRETLPTDVDVTEYGIRGVHLAYELLKGNHHTLILVDAMPLDEAPGTVAVLEIGERAPSQHDAVADVEAPGVDAHTMTPDSVLRVLETLGGHVDHIFVVGCQPQVFDQGMQLSAPVRRAVDEATSIVVRLATEMAETAEMAENPRNGNANRAQTEATTDRLQVG
ncbi:MAG: hydrogenase maturation protease [Acidothermaceae bacterium]